MSTNVVSPFSGTRAESVWGKRDGKDIYRCPNTDVVFFDRLELHGEDYQEYYPYLKGWDDERFVYELGIRRNKYRAQLKLLAAYAPGRRLVDVGAGPGYLCKVAEEELWDATGVEIAEEAVACGVRHFGVQYASSVEDLQDASVDVITCHHVLEHVEQPAEFVNSMYDKLVPGGVLAIHVPHQQPFSFKIRDCLRKVLSHNADTFCSLYGEIHISGFTRKSLREFMRSRGFDELASKSVGMWSPCYDPFFVMNYCRDRQYGALTRKFARHVVDLLGIPFGIGDWVVGYYRKPRG